MIKKINRSTHLIRGPVKPDISVIIPAAGEGVRCRSLGVKSLIPISNEHTILSRQLELVQNIISPKEIVIVGGFEAERLFNKSDQKLLKVENENYQTTNILRSIGLALRVCSTENIIIIHGDLVFSSDSLKFPLEKSLLVLDSGSMAEEEVGVTVCDGEVEHLYYDLPKKWGQISYFQGREIKLLRGLAYNSDKFKLYAFEAINEIMNKGGKFLVYENSNVKMVDIDKPSDIERAKQLIRGN